MSIDEDEYKLFRQGRYASLKWSSEERVFQHTRKYREKVFPRYTFTLTSALFLKYKKSVLGGYLDIFNLPQKQDRDLNENKLGITKWDIQRYSERNLKLLQSRNGIFDDYMKVLNNAVSDCEVIDLDYIKDITTRIELTSNYINSADSGLKKFANVRILVLLGNNLRDLPGSCLPRRLLYLELYDNFISDLTSLVKGAPKHLQHLGLGRNKLNDNSLLHLLAESKRFQRLQNLDLSANDIYTLETAMAALTGLKSLVSFSLEGNPCAVVILYKEIVLHYLSWIQYLDNVEVLETDRGDQESFEEGDKQAQIIFKCYRIMGLPKPPKDNKSIQTIHVEFEMPLMETVHIFEKEIPVVLETPDKVSKKNDKDNGKDAEKLKSPGKASKSTTKMKKSSPYSKPNEYDTVEEKNNFYFKTARMPWEKIIEFPPVVVESPEKDLGCVRDTFRSAVNVRVVYLKVAKPGLKKKGGKKEKPSKAAKSGTTSKTLISKSVEEIEPQEVVLKRVTLCSFYCHLRESNWSDETVDFYWADHINFNSSQAMRVEGCLKAIRYAQSGEKTPKKGRDESAVSISTSEANVINALPKVLTCQIGFGLNRSVTSEFLA